MDHQPEGRHQTTRGRFKNIKKATSSIDHYLILYILSLIAFTTRQSLPSITSPLPPDRRMYMYTLDYGFDGEMADDDMMWESAPVASMDEAAKAIASIQPDDWEVIDHQGRDVSREVLKILKTHQREARAALLERKKAILAS
jgi:hypothetical protein